MTKIQFPPEWYPQSAIQLTWPHKDSDWAYMLDEITTCCFNIACEIMKRQKLIIVCQNQLEIKQLFKNQHDFSNNLTIVEIPSNDTWARDHGGISVFVDGKPCVYDFGFNGWGLKFAANHDNQISRRLKEKNIFSDSVELINMKNFILEGGGIETDGKGTLLTTSECLLSPNRNGSMKKQEIESYLINTFGLERVLWLDHGYLSGDDTDSHIDTLARFCDEYTIAYITCQDVSDEHFESLLLMEKQLKKFTTFAGKSYKLIPLPMAEKVVIDGERLPATYANFLIMNDAVLLPTYNTKTDFIAKRQLEIAFPNKEIVCIDCLPVIKQHGSLHCLTMQYPRGIIA